MTAAPRPTLQEIADMPLTQGVDAMRKFYDDKWRAPLADGDPVMFTVRVEWERTETGVCEYEIEAASEDAAKDEARDRANCDEGYGEEFTIERVVIVQ